MIDHDEFCSCVFCNPPCIWSAWCSVLQEERKTLDRELARAKVTANRVATVVANEWKDANDKVMPVKQWLEERRFLQVNFDFTLNHCIVGALI